MKDACWNITLFLPIHVAHVLVTSQHEETTPQSLANLWKCSKWLTKLLWMKKTTPTTWNNSTISEQTLHNPKNKWDKVYWVQSPWYFDYDTPSSLLFLLHYFTFVPSSPFVSPFHTVFTFSLIHRSFQRSFFSTCSLL